MWTLSITVLFLPSSHHPLVYGFTSLPQAWRLHSPPAAAVAISDVDNNERRYRDFNTLPRRRKLVRSALFMCGQYNDDSFWYDMAKNPFEPRSESPLHRSASDGGDKLDAVKQWLLFHLPKLQPCHVEDYAKKLVGDGFDSAEMLGEVVVDDLDFMKVAHQRALGKKLNKEIDITRAKGVAKALDRLAGGGTNGNDGTAEADSSPLPADEEEECEGEECFDITRGTFSERMTQSLSTTLPPSKVLATAMKERRAEESIGGRQNEVYFDITQNMFPERPRSLMKKQLALTKHSHKRAQTTHTQ